MITRFISFLFAITASTALVGSILMLYPRQRLTDEDFYTQVVVESNVGSQTQEVIQNNLDSFLKDKLKVDEDNKFPPGLSAVILRAVMDRIDVKDVVNKTLTENGSYIADWLSGESELYMYFPREEIIISYQENSGNEDFITDIMNMSGYDGLPDCSAASQISESNFLKNEISCGGVLVREFMKNEITKRIQSGGSSLIEGFLNSVAPGLGEKTEVDIANSDFFQKTRLGKLPGVFSRVQMYGIVLGIVAIMAAVISSWLSRHPARSFLKVLLNTSIILIVFSLVAKLALRIVMDFMFWSKISFSPESYSQEQIDQILGLFKNLFGTILDKLLLEIVIIGLVMLAVTAVLYILLRIAGLTASTREDEEFEDDDFEEDESEGDGSEEIRGVKNSKKFEEKLLEQKPSLR